VGSNKHTLTEKVWRGILIMREQLGHFDYKKLKQYEADAMIRAVAYAEARRIAWENEQARNSNPPPRWRYNAHHRSSSSASEGDE